MNSKRWAATGIVAMSAVVVMLADLSVAERASAHSEHAYAAGEPGDPKKPFRIIEVEMREGAGTMSYMPDRIEVKKGEQIKFVLKNAGALDHEFLLDSVEHNAKHKIVMQKNPEMEHDEPNGKRLQPKAGAQILWKFTKRGTFEFACLIPGHYEAGMHGTVLVK
jgi:uncharacterized cupredoxin-like copper-binding protein